MLTVLTIKPKRVTPREVKKKKILMFFRKAKRIEALTEDVSRLERELVDEKRVTRIAQDQTAKARMNEEEFRAMYFELDTEFTLMSNELRSALGDNTAFRRDMQDMAVPGKVRRRILEHSVGRPSVVGRQRDRIQEMWTLVSDMKLEPEKCTMHIRARALDGKGGMYYSCSEAYLARFGKGPRQARVIRDLLFNEVSKVLITKENE